MESAFTDSFAVVRYLQDELAAFVDSLRREFTPGCPHRAHLTVLPPRSLSMDREAAIERCNAILESFGPFDVEISSVEMFESTQVIKLGIGRGKRELKGLHELLNTGPFHALETYEYNPHITLCMEAPAELVPAYFAMARERWQHFGKPPAIHIDELTFVQQRENGIWEDLAALSLDRAEPVGVRRSA